MRFLRPAHGAARASRPARGRGDAAGALALALVLVGLVALTGCSHDAGTPAVAAPTTAMPLSAMPVPLSPPKLEPAPATTPAPSTTATTVPQRPYSISTKTLSFVDESRATVTGDRTIATSRSLTTLVWYPSDGGRWPLVVFAHGYQVGPQPYVSMLRTWAAAGYVVAAPEFPLTDEAVAGPDLDEADIDNQPADVGFVFKSLLASDSPLADRIDSSRLGVAGHSDGAQTALALAANSPVKLGGVMVLSGGPTGLGPARNVPILVAHGDQDDIDPYDDGVAVYDQSSSPRFMLTLVGGGHLPPFTAGSHYQDVVDKTTIDFLDAYVGRNGLGVPLTDFSQRGLDEIKADP